MITGNVIGGVIKTPDTIILVDENGNEYTAVTTGEEVELTATTNDVRLGKVAALSTGVKTGDKYIPGYLTFEGFHAIPDGSEFKIPLQDSDGYDFNKLQVIFCGFDTSILNSVSANKISIYEKVFDVQSNTPLTNVTKNHNDKTIEFGFTNNTGEIQILRYFTYKEI